MPGSRPRSGRSHSPTDFSLAPSRILLASLCVAVVAVAGVAPSLMGGFVYDDVPLLVQNPAVRGLSNLPRLATSGLWDFSGQGQGNFFRPGQMVAYVISYQLAGLKPLVFRLQLLAFHLTACLLVLAFLSRWTGSPRAALIGALLFAAHPVHVEATAWVAGVSDVGMTLFSLAALVALLPAGDGPSWRPGRVVAGAAFCLAALLFKEMAIILPALWCLVAISAPGRRGSSTHRQPILGVAILLGAVCAVYMAWRISALGGAAPGSGFAPLSTGGLLLNAPWALAWYLMKVVFPASLSVDPGFKPLGSLIDPRALAALGACAGLVVIFILLWRRGQRMAACALAWVPVALLPVLNLSWVSRSLVAERYLYLPSVGLCALAGIGLDTLAARRRPLARVVTVLVVGLALAGAARSAARAAEWRTNTTLFLAESSRRPDSGHLHFWLASGHKEEGRLDEARREYELAAKLDASVEAASAVNALPIAVARGEMTDLEAASRYADIAARTRHPIPQLYANLGIALLRGGKRSEAVAPLETATRLDPNNARSWAYYALALAGPGQQERRLEAARKAVALDPENLQAQQVLAVAAIEQGQWEEARSALSRSRALGAPEDWCRAMEGRMEGRAGGR